jgi:hypothetical protein
MNRILARYGHEQNAPTLWELPDNQSVYLVHPDQPTKFIRICSTEEFQTNHRVLVNQGWILEK